ncbi:MAG: hypothetical protein BV458_13200 [Thermoplasmata archaeon M9B2D]|nr:MAG: hypothetical protein BV458_13200 [Thermoplasmata archaeon M9B2D]
MKRKRLAVGIILLFVGTSIIPAIAQETEKPLQTSRGEWLYVGGSGPGNYTTIQSAINDANPGDTVFVFNGTYYEVLVVNKTIDLIGEDRDTTVIDGGWGIYVVDVSSDGVTITGFTIHNGAYGIRLVSSSNNTVTGNTASNSSCGIFLDTSSFNTIRGNTASNNAFGIRLSSSSYNTVMCNTASNNVFGIALEFTSNNTVMGNNVTSNSGDGIALSNSSNNTVTENNAHANRYDGIYLDFSSNNNLLYHNNIMNNTQNAADDGSNIWDNEYPSGGNYWSDYTGIDGDGDGIGDTPYDIPGGDNQDRYPFIEPNGWMNEPPDLIIGITGILGINLLITNNGQTDANNVSWVIHVQGRRILGQINKTENGTTSIPAGETNTIRTGILFFLGRITIMVKVANEEQIIQGFKMGLFFFLII